MVMNSQVFSFNIPSSSLPGNPNTMIINSLRLKQAMFPTDIFQWGAYHPNAYRLHGKSFQLNRNAHFLQHTSCGGSSHVDEQYRNRENEVVVILKKILVKNSLLNTMEFSLATVSVKNIIYSLKNVTTRPSSNKQNYLS